jgi:hypothetical protein
LLIFPIVDPSGFLDGDTTETRAVSAIAMSLSSQVLEANLALNYFLEARSKMGSGSQSHEALHEEWQRTVDERREIELSLRADAGLNEFERVDWDKMRLAVDIELLKRKTARGQEPRGYTFHRPFLFAKSFVFYLDRIHRMLGVCQHYEMSCAAAKEALSQIENQLPDLREFRNSIAHFEDRVRGRHQARRERKDIELKPLDTPLIKAGGGALVLECMENDVFRSILADGTLGSIPIRAESMEVIQRAVQTFLDGLPWKHSHAQIVPNP